MFHGSVDLTDWATVEHGCSETDVRHSPDGTAYAKTAHADHAAFELLDERDRLGWLTTVDLPAPRVLDWLDGERPTLVTSAVPGVPVCDLPPDATFSGVEALRDAIGRLRALDPDGCPFDRRLATTIAAARSHVEAGLVDEDDFDDVRRGRTATDLLTELLASTDEMAGRGPRPGRVPRRRMPAERPG